MSSFDFSSPVIRDRTQESGMQLCQGRFALDNRKMFITQRVVGTGTDSTGTGHSTESGRVQEGFRQCSQAHGVVLGVSCAGAGVGLQCPCRLSMILKSIFNAIFMAIPVCVFVFFMFQGIRKDIFTFFNFVSKCSAYLTSLTKSSLQKLFGRFLASMFEG